MTRKNKGQVDPAEVSADGPGPAAGRPGPATTIEGGAGQATEGLVQRGATGEDGSQRGARRGGARRTEQLLILSVAIVLGGANARRPLGSLSHRRTPHPWGTLRPPPTQRRAHGARYMAANPSSLLFGGRRGKAPIFDDVVVHGFECLAQWGEQLFGQAAKEEVPN
jgi:hypothetical protein